jgi:hypothetical protein
VIVVCSFLGWGGVREQIGAVNSGWLVGGGLEWENRGWFVVYGTCLSQVKALDIDSALSTLFSASHLETSCF